MKRFFFLLVFLVSCYSAQSQDYSLDEINTKRCQHTLNGMIAFSSWTGVNLVGSTVGVLTTEGEWQHFFEMNLYFNAINAGLAIPGLIGAIRAQRTGLDFETSVKEVQKIKTIYLVNGALDVSYITFGFLLREIARNPKNSNQRDRFNGFGSSMIVQGGFLLLYDFIAFGIHAANGKKLDSHWKKLSVHPAGDFGLGIGLTYQLHDEKPIPPSFQRLALSARRH